MKKAILSDRELPKAMNACVIFYWIFASNRNSQCKNNISCQYDAMFSSYCTYLFIYIYLKQNGTLTFVLQYRFHLKMLWLLFVTFLMEHLLYYMLSTMCCIYWSRRYISGLMMNILIMQTIRPIIAFYFIFLFMLIRHSSSNKMNTQGHPDIFFDSD